MRHGGVFFRHRVLEKVRLITFAESLGGTEFLINYPMTQTHPDVPKEMRQELRKRGIGKLKVVYSKEPPLTPIDDMTISCRTHCICPPGTARKCTQRRQVPGSNAFVPSVVGLIIAGEVVKDLAGYGRG